MLLTDAIVAELERMADKYSPLHPTWVATVVAAVLAAKNDGKSPDKEAAVPMNQIVRAAVRAFASQAVRFIRRAQMEAN